MPCSMLVAPSTYAPFAASFSSILIALVTLTIPSDAIFVPGSSSRTFWKSASAVLNFPRYS